MAKDPAFLFYPNDWLGETLGMTLEEKGAYTETLVMQFNSGHLSQKVIENAIGLSLWEEIKKLFTQDQDGLFYSKRLETEQMRRREYVASRHNNRNGKNQYSKDDLCF